MGKVSNEKTETIFERLFKRGLLKSLPLPESETKRWSEVFPKAPPLRETVSVEETIAFIRGRGDEE